MQAIDKLDPPSKQKLAADLAKNIQDQKVSAASTPNTGDEPTTPEQRAAHVAAGGKFDLKTGQPIPLDNAPADPVSGKTPEEAMKDPRYASDPAFKAEVDKAAAIGTPPAAQGMEIDPAKDAADKAAKNQADADQRNADIEKTKQANAAANQQDASIKAAADAAKAKPPFQQTAADKLAIKAAADKGIREAEEKKKKLKRKKIIAEFKSKFLGMKI